MTLVVHIANCHYSLCFDINIINKVLKMINVNVLLIVLSKSYLNHNNNCFHNNDHNYTAFYIIGMICVLVNASS